MRGVLGSSSVSDLCRGLAEAGSTGELVLESPDGDGRIGFRDGRVRSASSPAPSARLGDRLVNAALLTQDELDRALERQAGSSERTKLGAILVDEDLVSRDAIRVFVQEQILDAVFELMSWRQGTYEFQRGATADDKLPVDIPVDQLLVEVSRRQSEWDQIERVLPDLDMVPDFRSGGSSADAALEPDEFAMLASVDGQRSIRDQAAHLGYSEFEAARIVYGLILIGVIGVREPDEDTEAADSATPADTAGGPEAKVEPTEGEGDEEDDVDIGRALEEAMFGEEPEPAPSDKPSVRVHLDDLGHFPRQPDDTHPDAEAAPAEPDDEGDDRVAAEDEAASEPASAPEQEPEPDDLPEPAVFETGYEEPTDDTEPAPGRDEPEPELETELELELEPEAGPEPASRAEPEPEPVRAEVEEPEPWTPDPAEFGLDEVDEEPPPESDQPEEAETEGGRDLDDDEFERLINELAGAAEVSVEQREDTEPTPEPPPPADRDSSDEAEPEPAPEPTSPEPAAEKQEEKSGGNVSEFLRELSRLAVDDEDGDTAEPVAPPTREDSKRDNGGGRDASTQRQEQKDKKDKDSDDGDDKKKRGFFGWGR